MGKHWAKHGNIRQARSFISGAILLRLQQRRGEASDTFRAQPCRTFLCLEQKPPYRPGNHRDTPIQGFSSYEAGFFAGYMRAADRRLLFVFLVAGEGKTIHKLF